MKFFSNLIAILICLMFSCPLTSYSAEALDLINKLAKKYHISQEEAFTVMFVSDIEAAAIMCKFKLTDNFFEGKEKLLNEDWKRMDLYLDIMRSLTDSFPNKQQYCRDHYQMFGPNARRGPHGGNNQMYK